VNKQQSSPAAAEITMREFSMPLNNAGDAVSLFDAQGQIRHHVSYSVAQAATGQVRTFK
jgi:hypothetical protein